MFCPWRDDINKKQGGVTARRGEAHEMGELSIRRNKNISVPRYQGTAKAEKQSGAAKAQQVPGRAADTVSETLRRLMTQVSQVDRHVREGRRTLQTGEAALAEVGDSLERMEELAQRSAGEGTQNRAALQDELERLRGEIDRVARQGVEAGLFQDGDGLDGLEALVDAVMDGLSARQEGVQSVPGWLLQGLESAPDKAALLTALGVDASATGPELLAALGKLPLDSSAGGYLAALYLGSVIAGGSPSGPVDLEQAAEGLRQFLETVAQGLSPDEAVDLLTGGAFTSLEDFQAQFSGGTAPGLEDFLTNLLLSGGGEQAAMPSMGALLTGGGELELLMGLLDALGGSGDGLMALLDGAEASAAGPGGGTAQTMEAQVLGTVQATGRDLSGAALDPETGVLTAGGPGELTLRGLGQEAPALRLTGEGTVTLHQIASPLLTTQSAQARLLTAGENALAQLQLGEATVLTVDGGGLLRIGLLRGEASSALRLTGGAVELGVAQNAQVVVDGPVSLLAAQGIAVQNAQGKPLTPFDVVWKALLPEWSALTSLGVDGKHTRLALPQDQPDPLRLWLLKGNDQDRPVHTLVFRGRDKAGHPQVRYAYVRWDDRAGSFQETSMYPNPFTVTGGEQGVDWRYEEETHTLHILTSQVTAVSGGAGTDGNQLPFSGRIALADSLGRLELALDGVECRVSSGRAFDLGRGNAVTLLLQRGTDNVFESGPGCAGISLGEGTSLTIDQLKGDRSLPDGVLNATGGAGGAGIGRDSGAATGQTDSIFIRGGVVVATGSGGGAGIGGALGAAVGDIRIQGGTVTALASCCAAAIGAGIQGACGDIAITGSAKVAKAQGGGPDGDIGGCLFGNCGKVQVDPGLNLGSAKLWTQRGFSLQMGEGSVTLPRFRVTARALRLDGLDVSTRQAAQAALEVLAADRRWVTRLQGAYGAMYGQLAQSFGGMYNVHRQFSVVRDTSEASSLVMDIREVLRLSPRAKFLAQRGMEDVGLLLR